MDPGFAGKARAAVDDFLPRSGYLPSLEAHSADLLRPG
jgi:hypothetical protein